MIFISISEKNNINFPSIFYWCQALEFKVVLNLKKILNDFIKPWYIAGGWAIDLYLGKVTRMHKDIEITIFRRDQRELYEYLKDWIFYKVIPGKYKRERWERNEWLSLPIHEIHATSHSKEHGLINFEMKKTFKFS